MTGLKSGSGDDLWGDDEDGEEDAEAADSTDGDVSRDDGSGHTSPDTSPDRSTGGDDAGMATGGSPTPEQGETQPYIVRRAIQDKSVQFERDERLTFFVHDDVVDGERELLSDAEAALGRSVPKFDLREAVYRAAIRNEEDVLAELVRMGYTLDDQ
jgi:hypothetical protein